jgi:putative transcriptional regulator
MLQPKIKQLIDAKGLKQTFVAEQIGVTPQQLNAWIKGKTYPRIDRAYKLAEVLECKMDDLWEEE